MLVDEAKLTLFESTLVVVWLLELFELVLVLLVVEVVDVVDWAVELAMLLESVLKLLVLPE